MVALKQLSSCLPLALATILLSTPSTAQRPDDASVCDYYAEERYGANDTESQHKLVKHIVTLAFEGGTALDNTSSTLTGILQPGRFDDKDVDLRSWFNGSRASTNVNNAPIGINWLDGGGTEPLSAFLTGSTDDVVLGNTTNQAHLFGNFFVAFSRVFSCSFPFPPLPHNDGPINPAYVHKFMNLEWHQLGYFISQLTQAAQYYGFSQQDALTISNRLNSFYNVRCAPAVTFNPRNGPQLLSLCQNPTCPLAAPVSDCAAYDNLTAQGIIESEPTTILATATITESSPENTATSASQTPSDSAAAAGNSDSLSAGAIAGISIGSAAVVVIAAIAGVFFCFKRRKNKRELAAQQTPQQQFQNPQHMSTTSDWVGAQQHQSVTPTSPWMGRSSHMSYGGTLSEMGTTAYSTQGEADSRVASPDRHANSPYNSYYQNVSPRYEMGHGPAAEMEAAPIVVHQGQEYMGPKQ
ncbi:hypothetical protein B0T11DRAFT_277864 [Plectosphaerella cucumerina]|uniref:Uncharacterized protein n=1 Tax=Plectosphaerella cucumerina TaxID=40658 RepID=A0A8K0TQJ2_9PEZI|nr:hypothetical protein B0T11DRAFT_277864 [Plectosphaerella cucumerina]